MSVGLGLQVSAGVGEGVGELRLGNLKIPGPQLGLVGLIMACFGGLKGGPTLRTTDPQNWGHVIGRFI